MSQAKISSILLLTSKTSFSIDKLVVSVWLLGGLSPRCRFAGLHILFLQLYTFPTCAAAIYPYASPGFVFITGKSCETIQSVVYAVSQVSTYNCVFATKQSPNH